MLGYRSRAAGYLLACCQAALCRKSDHRVYKAACRDVCHRKL